MSEYALKAWSGLSTAAPAAWQTLHSIGKAIEKANGSLPSVRRDSREWSAWRSWFQQHGMSTRWSDRQPDDRMMTVTMPFPPSDDELLTPAALIGRYTGKHSKDLKE